MTSGLKVTGNEDRIRQVLTNLLSNAVKYNRFASPTIQLRVSVHSENLQIDIVGNDGGVSYKDATIVFKKFWSRTKQ
jgi:signal transduction histidine kinase